MSAPLLDSLASLIRHFRVQAGLTQEELAEKAGLSVRAISDLERSQRTAPRMETLRMLSGALGLDPDQRRSLFAAALPEIATPPAALANDVSSRPAPASGFGAGRSGLPIPPTRLVGREHDLSHLGALLDTPDMRLVTLTGPGGVGKTRLAIAMATERQSRAGEDVAFVDLSPVSRPDNLATSIIESLALSSMPNRSSVEALCDALRDRSLLLLLDNFEHLLGAAADVATLLEQCRNLRMLVTSRERLQLRGEHVFAISPLPLPSIEESSLATLSSISASPAIQLFLERAREVRFDLDVSEADAPTIARICQRLDGLPLAIELAASWMRYEPAQALLERLTSRLPALTGGARDLPARQQTLRSTIAWSYDLLPPAQQALFRALCVFPGGFAVEAAVAIADRQASRSHQLPQPGRSKPDTGPAPLDTVISLMEHSLIQQSAGPNRAYRFTILETVREFGLELLAERGEAIAARRDLLSWLVSLTAPPDLEALDGYVGSARFSLPNEEGNLRVALDIAIEQDDIPAAVRIALALAPLWWEHGLFAEARSALDSIIARADQLEPAVLGIVLGWAAEWAWLQSDYRRTSELARSALAICQSVDDDAGTAANLYRLGRVSTALDPPAARPLLEEALALNQRLNNDRDAAWNLLGLAYAATMLNDLDGVERYVEQARGMLARLDDPKRGGLAVSLEHAGAWIAFKRGDLEIAAAELERSLIECREEGFEFGACNALRSLGTVARKRGDLERAASLQVEALRLAQKQGALRRECYCLVELAGIAQAMGQSKRAARLLGAESALRRHLGHFPSPDELDTLSETRSSAIEKLGEPAFDRERLSGESFDWSARLDEASSIQPSQSE